MMKTTENNNGSPAGLDTVVHLAADPRYEAPWDGLLKNNIEGAYRVFEAALATGCRRVVFASSTHAVLGNPLDDVVELARRNGKRVIRNMVCKGYRRRKRLLKQF